MSGSSGWPSLFPGQRAHRSKDRAPTRGAPTSRNRPLGNFRRPLGANHAGRRSAHPGPSLLPILCSPFPLWGIGSSRFTLVGERHLPNHALKETATAICRGRPCACPRLVNGAMGHPPGVSRQIIPAVLRRDGLAGTLGARASRPPSRRKWKLTIFSGSSGWPPIFPGQRAYRSKDRAPTRGAPTNRNRPLGNFRRPLGANHAGGRPAHPGPSRLPILNFHCGELAAVGSHWWGSDLCRIMR